jgi:hypothetical protein
MPLGAAETHIAPHIAVPVKWNQSARQLSGTGKLIVKESGGEEI